MENEINPQKPLKNYDAMEPLLVYSSKIEEVKVLEAQGLSRQEINRKRAEEDM